MCVLCGHGSRTIVSQPPPSTLHRHKYRHTAGLVFPLVYIVSEFVLYPVGGSTYSYTHMRLWGVRARVIVCVLYVNIMADVRIGTNMDLKQIVTGL